MPRRSFLLLSIRRPKPDVVVADPEEESEAVRAARRASRAAHTPAGLRAAALLAHPGLTTAPADPTTSTDAGSDTDD